MACRNSVTLWVAVEITRIEEPCTQVETLVTSATVLGSVSFLMKMHSVYVGLYAGRSD